MKYDYKGRAANVVWGKRERVIRGEIKRQSLNSGLHKKKLTFSGLNF